MLPQHRQYAEPVGRVGTPNNRRPHVNSSSETEVFLHDDGDSSGGEEDEHGEGERTTDGVLRAEGEGRGRVMGNLHAQLSRADISGGMSAEEWSGHDRERSRLHEGSGYEEIDEDGEGAGEGDGFVRSGGESRREGEGGGLSAKAGIILVGRFFLFFLCPFLLF